MEYISDLFEEVWFTRIVYSLLTIVIGVLIYLLITNTLITNLEKKKFKNSKTKTYVKLVRSTIKYTIILIVIFMLLQINGINISSMVAGVGIMSVIFGFAIQDALKDIIKGFDIISDSYYEVGDVIKFGSITGRVLSIGLKTTKVEDITTFNIVSISNRNIEQVEVVSNLINIDIPISYELKVAKVEDVIKKIVETIKADKNVDNCEYRGINEFADSSIKYHIKVYCNPLKKVQVRRDALGYIIRGLEDNNIEIPYNQIDVHQK